MQKCAFLDRDGVINEDLNYVHKIEDFIFCEGIFALLDLLKQKGFLLIVVTNQSGIERGFYTEAQLEALHGYMQKQVESKLGFGFDKIYHCPHLPESHCECRKPRIGMIQSACRDFDIDLSHSLFIGDRLSDMECAINAKIPHQFLITDSADSNISQSPILGKDNENIQIIKHLSKLYSIIQANF